MKFNEFPKIPRLKRSVIISEKIDGTNASIYIAPTLASVGELAPDPDFVLDRWIGEDGMEYLMLAGSRTRWIRPGADNFGFAGWVVANRVELRKLGPGQHFGEWWGLGIQCGYGLTERRFSLFNTARWNEDNPNRPACCSVVPVLAIHDFGAIEATLEKLKREGSVAAPGFMKPEGIVVYHSAARSYFKVLLENDDVPKSQAKTAEAA